ncbi:MAG: outer membrane beta-barrel protein [Ferruginibacter sp.]
MQKYLLILFLYVGLSAKAQQKARCEGFVRESQIKPLQGVTVALFSSGDGTPIAQTQTDGMGEYHFQALSIGRYYIKATFIGMQAATSAVFDVSDKMQIMVADIILIPQLKGLQNITVTATDNPIETKNGKLIYNIEKSLTARGTSAFDQVRKTPGVSVDAEEKLTLKGSSTFTIMIDGKQTYLGGQQLSTYLKSLTAENLTRIEVMATPSSQYDAAGNAGIINIVTKKISRQGYALNIMTGVGAGKYMQSSDGFVGNIRTRRFNFFGSYNYNFNHSNLVRTSYRTISTNGKTVNYDRHSIDPAVAKNNSFKAGTDLYLSKKTTLGLTYTGTHNHWSRNGGGPTYLRNATGSIDSVAENKNVTLEPSNSNTYNVNLATRIDTSGGQFSIDADYASYHNNSTGSLNNGLNSISGIPLQPNQSLAFQQPSNITIRSIKTDLVFPHKGVTWKTGAKYAYVRTDNNFRYDSLLNGSYVYSSVLSNHFIYDEKVAAAYLSFNTPLNKTILVDAGARLEHTHSMGNLVNTNTITDRDYTNLFPYLSVTKMLTDDNNFNLSITRRINRPVYANLNPSRYFFDKYSYYEGNPFLQPELSWNTGITYTLRKNYVATFTYGYTTDAILDFSVQNSTNGVLRVGNRNFSHKNAADLLLVVPFKQSKFWSVHTTVDLIYISYSLTSGKDIFLPHKVNIDVQLAQEFSLPKGFGFELTTFYTSPSLGGIYILRTYFQTDAAVRKTLFKNKLDAVLSCRDIFRTNRYWAYSIYGPTNIRYDHRPDSRRVNLALTCHIGGKLSAGKDRRLEEQKRL